MFEGNIFSFKLKMFRISHKLKVEFEKAQNAIWAAERILIISHRGPDGDAVGSNLGLRLALEDMGKKVTSACVDPVGKDSIFLKKGDTFVTDFE